MHNILIVTNQPVAAIGIKSVLVNSIGKGVEVHDVSIDEIITSNILPKQYDCMIVVVPSASYSLIKMLRKLFKDIPILLYADVMAPSTLIKMYKEGLSGFLSLNKKIEELAIAFNIIMSGKLYLEDDFQKYLFGKKNVTSFGNKI